MNDNAIYSSERMKNIKNFRPHEATTYKTVKEIYVNTMAKYSKNVFALEKRNPKDPAFKEYTYEDFDKHVNGLGTGLEKVLGLAGKPIVIVGENSYNWYISYMALLIGSCIAVPIDKELPANEFERLVNRSRAAAVIYSPKKKELIEEVKANVPTVEYFIEMYSDAPVEGNTVGFNTVMAEGTKLVEQGDKYLMDVKVEPETFKVLIFTSGTTAASKGVMLSERNLAENINAVSAYVKLYENDRLLSVLPLHHTYESSIGFLVPFAWGSSIAVCQGLKYIVKNLKETKPTIVLTVPLLIENIYKKVNDTLVKTKKDKLVARMIKVTNVLAKIGINIKRKVFKEILDNLGGRVRLLISAAAPIDPKIGEWLIGVGIAFLQGYGLTETAPISALEPEFRYKTGTIGLPVNCADLKIVNPNDNGEGEIMIKSKTLMIGYYEDEEATKEAITEDGWFHSGDMGFMDEDGYVSITGRLKNVIVTQNGKNIYPEEVETVVMQNHPEIKECMVYGAAGREGDKESIIAIKVIPDYDVVAADLGKDKADKDDAYNVIWAIIKEVNKTLTSYKNIKQLEIKEDEFEKTSTMKIKRFAELAKDKAKKENN